MREILFRGKRVDNGEWVYGAYYKQKQFYGDKMEKDCIITSDDVLSNDLGLDYEEVIPETVGQYTGLTDKNGKKIFEGDIIYGAAHWLERYKKAVVIFQDGSFGLEWYRGNVREFNAFTSMCNVEYEIIGNVHDNKELLGEQA